MAEPWTIRRVLAWMAQDFAGLGLSSPRLDAELLLCHALGIDRVRLYMDMDRPLDPAELAGAKQLVRRRRVHEPVAYITGRREFYARDFEVSPDVLIPRPETEVLVDRLLERVAVDATGRALDLCTGSGCIAITLAVARPGFRVDAVDVSRAALEVARRNAAAQAVAERVEFHEGDLFEGLSPGPWSYDVLTANPPYVSESEWHGLAPDIRDHEPRQALVCADEGLSVVRRIVSGAGRVLRAGGFLLVEIGSAQGPVVRAAFEGAGFTDVGVHPDLAGHPRVVSGRAASGA